jgi:two-component system osmolarity sensor histidine kinase EnvZ
LNLLPRSLLSRTAITISMALLLSMVITLAAAVNFVAIPIGKRSADDLAALMILAANTWHETDATQHTQLRQRFLNDHGLVVAARTPNLPELKIDYPYFLFLQDALSKRSGTQVVILKNPGGQRVWVDIPVNGDRVRIGISRKRISARPPIVLLLVVTGGIFLALLTSLAVVRRVIGPLERLSAAAKELGHGSNPPPLAEDGPQELASLARAFNRMSTDVHELIDNRTVMVAGISHDLRTPLTRLGLAIEMLHDDTDPHLINGIRRDLSAMENLIRQFMELAQGLTEQRQEDLDLRQVLGTQVDDFRRAGHDIHLIPGPTFNVAADRVALERILANLLDNAAHYGAGKTIEVELRRVAEKIRIQISDRGPGIPTDQLEAVFRPFHRLDSARENRTGGSGLGLAIARQLAKKNGWSIKLLPRSGGGTVATVHLHTR